jgi:hypothetical protein
VILPPKKNYIPQFLKQRDINSYYGHHLLLSKENQRKTNSIKIKKYIFMQFDVSKL